MLGPTCSASAVLEILNGRLCAAQGWINVCSSSHWRSVEHHCVPPKNSRLCWSIPVIAKRASQCFSPHTNLEASERKSKREAAGERTRVGVPAAKAEWNPPADGPSLRFSWGHLVFNESRRLEVSNFFCFLCGDAMSEHRCKVLAGC